MKRIQRYCLLFLDILKHLGYFWTRNRVNKRMWRAFPLVLLGLVVMGLSTSGTGLGGLSVGILSRAELASTSSQLIASGVNWKTQVSQVEKKWESDYESYFSQNLTDSKLTAPDIAQILAQISLKTGTKPGVLWVVPEPEGLVVVLITPGKEPWGQIQSNIKLEQLKTGVINLYQELTNPRKLQSRSYLEPAQQLYNAIIKPVEPQLEAEKIDTLLFCLGAGLRTLPLGVLHDGERFLIEKYSLTRIPAFNLMNLNYESLKDAFVLAMGASEFKNQNPLPAVPFELATIVNSDGMNGIIRLPIENPQNLGQWEGQSYLNQGFTVNNLKQLLSFSPYRIVHLATHAEFKPGKPGNSYIQFWDEQLKLDQMGQFNWKNPPIELLVLSACKTAVGDEDAELGFAGLAFQSGVKTALASLWYVSDTGTLALMSEFYQQLKTSSTKAKALQQTQIRMLKGDVRLQQGELLLSRGEISLPPEIVQPGIDNLSHPYYWAAFTLIGSPW
ncbi:CHAT domain-containing protein [Planktothrix sp. FACHB-1365]|uniref:CHAT domain-containing protein n=1 Tax=Planktothrix sp. FACHB-1365 TaxID=2692855 RepID=UPI00168718F3|nr:CHAT domain-containing protein [Planktothrix sp. FACHB-1365]MBD2485693.1 CHAT domain-containing protein [Planktothrix sp. FACHB-1365]